jgi:hypothetical protein
VTDPEPTWVPVLLGDVRVGDVARTIDALIPEGSRYLKSQGTIVAVRSGSVTLKIGTDSVVFQPEQLERLERPE